MFDSHCHLTDERFDEDREEVFSRAREAGVRGIVTVASNLADSRAAIALAESHEDTWCTVGIHPHEVEDARAEDAETIRALATESPVVAVGETGLDYFYDNALRTKQREWFARHLDLGVELGLPVIVHTRSADDDTVELLRAAPGGARTVLHCFTGQMRLLEEGLALGAYVSFSGIASFGKFEGQEAVRAVPRDRLLVETDAPYLAPTPERGRRNEPALLPHVVDAVARIRQEDPADVARYTAENACRFYDL